jgi:hypothetical protein
MNYFFTLVISFFCLPLLPSTPNELDLLATQFGTDKGPSWHNYTPTYHQYFSALRNEPIVLLEIGFHTGSSARMWDNYFSHPASRIYCMDIFAWCYEHMHQLSTRCSLSMVDQADESQLLQFAQTVCSSFDIIIDDGGHSMKQQIVSFKALFPYVKKGGLYIIEDLHTSYWSEYGSDGSMEHPNASAQSTIRFLQSLVDELNFAGARTSCADKQKLSAQTNDPLSAYQSDIESIHFYSSLCIIRKR